MPVDGLRRKAAITGIGELKPVRRTERTAEALMMEAARLSIVDAGLEASDIDGVLVTPPIFSKLAFAHASAVAEYLGIRPTFANVVDMAGASGTSQVWKAASAIVEGFASHVLCISGESLMQQGRRGPVRTSFFDDFELPFGPLGAPSGYALAATRHMHEYGTTPEQMARVAVDQRSNACANPDAMFYGQPITIDDVLSSRLVSDPLHLLEVVMPVSGAAAFVVSGADAARSMPHDPVYLLGAAEMIGHSCLSQAESITTSPIAYTGPTAMKRAGVEPQDIDMASLYDCFTITVLITIEDAGFCPKGKAGVFAAEHDLTFKGDFPVNTHGGQLSFGQAGLAGGTSHVIEAVRQLRGEANGRQVPDCELVFVNGNGGILAEQCSVVLGS